MREGGGDEGEGGSDEGEVVVVVVMRERVEVMKEWVEVMKESLVVEVRVKRWSKSGGEEMGRMQQKEKLDRG